MTAVVVLVGTMITFANLNMQKKSRENGAAGAAAEDFQYRQAASETDDGALYDNMEAVGVQGSGVEAGDVQGRGAGADGVQGRGAEAGDMQGRGAEADGVQENDAEDGGMMYAEKQNADAPGIDAQYENAQDENVLQYDSGQDKESGEDGRLRQETTEGRDSSGAVPGGGVSETGGALLVETVTESADYYRRLSEIDAKLRAKMEDSSTKNSADRQAVADEMLRFWDDELNDVYRKLRESLDEEDFYVLRDEERAWLRERDEAASAAAAAENTNSGLQSLAYTCSLAESTRVRVYELAELYFGVVELDD